MTGPDSARMRAARSVMALCDWLTGVSVCGGVWACSGARFGVMAAVLGGGLGQVATGVRAFAVAQHPVKVGTGEQTRRALLCLGVGDHGHRAQYAGIGEAFDR